MSLLDTTELPKATMVFPEAIREPSVLEIARNRQKVEKDRKDDIAKTLEPPPIAGVYPNSGFALPEEDMRFIEEDFNSSIATRGNSGPVIDYVTAAQGKVYIGGILLDEAYDIQYTYKESKEPIYGYNSKYFDAMVGGTAIVYGAFTINYKHDAYLHSILNKIGSGESESYQKNLIKANRNLKDVDYKQELQLYRSKQQELQETIKAIKRAKQNLDEQKLRQDEAKLESKLTSKDIEVRITAAKEDKARFWAAFTPEYQQQLTSEVKEFRDKINGEDSIESNSQFMQGLDQTYSSDMDQIKSKIDANEKEIASLRSDYDALVNLQKLTNAVDNPGKYNEIRNQIQVASDRMNELEEELAPMWEELRSTNDQKDLATGGYRDKIKGKQTEIAEFLNTKPNVKEAERLDLLIANLEAEQATIKMSNKSNESSQDEMLKYMDDSLETLKKKQSENEEYLKRSLEMIKGIKDEIDAFDASEMIKAMATDSKEKRAEDYRSFRLFIEYNGSIHKIIEDCTLTGHSHVLSQSGQPVKEMYTFFAREVV